MPGARGVEACPVAHGAPADSTGAVGTREPLHAHMCVGHTHTCSHPYITCSQVAHNLVHAAYTMASLVEASSQTARVSTLNAIK